MLDMVVACDTADTVRPRACAWSAARSPGPSDSYSMGLLRPLRFDDDREPMRRSDNHAALTDEVTRFQTEVRRLALAAVREVIRQELDRKLAKRPPARQDAGSRGRADTAVASVAARTREPPAAPRKREPLAAPRTREPPSPRTPEPPSGPGTLEPAAMPRTPEPPATPPSDGRKRVPWTRETVVSELASWMLSGMAIDASFVTRYGPRGLVAATRRIFGRFEAALNVAALHISKLYPEGPPTKPGASGR